MAVEQPITRPCPKCNLDLPFDRFGRDKSRPDGLTCWCKPCRRKSTRRWDVANPQKRAATKRHYRTRHGDRINGQRNAARAADPDLFRRQERRRYARNPALYRAKRARWGKEHPEYGRKAFRRYYQRHKSEFIARYVRTYRARKRHAPGRYTATDIERIAKLQRFRCAYCPTPLKGGRHVDHIIALVNGGSNWPRNLQLLCRRCNLSKGGSDPLDFARRIGWLL